MIYEISPAFLLTSLIFVASHPSSEAIPTTQGDDASDEKEKTL
jgi:hypothetical protein